MRRSACLSLRNSGTDLTLQGMLFAVPFGFGSFEPYALHVFSTPGNLSAPQVLVEEPDDELPQIALRGLQVEAVGAPSTITSWCSTPTSSSLSAKRWDPESGVVVSAVPCRMSIGASSLVT